MAPSGTDWPPKPTSCKSRSAYRTDAAKLRAIVPEPLELDGREALVKYEFIRMPDSNGFGDYTERSGDPGLLPRPKRQLHPLHVSQ
jgi:acetoacetate decarboxylase